MSKGAIRAITTSSAILAIVIVAFVHSNLFDYWLNIGELEKVAENFERSYGPDASIPIRPADREWGPTIKLISEYTRVSLPKHKEPRVIARSFAVSSAEETVGKGQIAQWTAPSTPLVVIYKSWPGSTVPPEDYRIVGSIGEFRLWIDEYRDKWKFIIDELGLVLLAFAQVVISQFGVKERGEPELPALC